MSCCAVLGQGAGIAAALSVRLERELDELPVERVQAGLTRQGVRWA